MNLDIEFSIWLAQFQSFEVFFSLISTRWFAAILVLIAGIYSIYIKKVRIFLFICIATSLGDFSGNLLKELLADTRPCFGFSEIFINEGIIKEECGPQTTGMPSNHAINFFLFSILLHLFFKNKYLTSIYFISSILVALSRVFLIKHLLSQVIIGAFIGIFLGIIFYYLFYRWIKT